MPLHDWQAEGHVKGAGRGASYGPKAGQGKHLPFLNLPKRLPMAQSYIHRRSCTSECEESLQLWTRPN